ncbi:MAG TPA: lipoprotein [Gammaproteobacteria bacterium]|nr:lipoprotein [Gammaproteobacteria bacterium]
MKTFIIFLLASVLLSGCGQSGKLYLPKDELSQSK